QAEDGIRDFHVTGVQTCALPIWRLNMWQIAVKPGKPLAFGEVDRADASASAFFIGLPGNPVSSFVTFLLFVRPFILRLQGVQNEIGRASCRERVEVSEVAGCVKR